MADAPEPLPPLAPEDTARITEFARACKAAARAVVLYPAAHPAIGATLGRIVQVTSASNMGRPLTFTVLPDGLLLDGRAAARPDPALAELADDIVARMVANDRLQYPARVAPERVQIGLERAVGIIGGEPRFHLLGGEFLQSGTILVNMKIGRHGAHPGAYGVSADPYRGRVKECLAQAA